MASRQGESRALAKRCEAVGWDVDWDGNKGIIKVTTPQGSFNIHQTYGDYNSLMLATRELNNRYGLEEAETRKAAEKKTTGRARTAAGREKAEAKARELEDAAKKATQAAALVRAAGPYLVEPETVGVLWFAEKHPAPWMRWVYVTAEIANYLLDNHNLPGKPGQPGTNRPQSESRIKYYRDTYLSNQWHLTHQGYAMDTEGKVQDGQHRMAAIVAAQKLIDALKEDLEAGRITLDALVKLLKTDLNFLQKVLLEGVRVPAAFFVGMAPENFAAIDDVLARDAGQLFTMAGEKNGATLRGATRLVIAVKSGDARDAHRKRISNLEIMAAGNAGGEQLRRMASIANSHARKPKIGVAGFAAGMYLIGEKNGFDNLYFEAFMQGVISGLKTGTRTILDDEDGRRALRETILDKKAKGETFRALDQVGLIITAWNYLVQGKHTRKFRWAKTQDIPEIRVCHDRGPHASAVPRDLVGEVTPEDLQYRQRQLEPQDTVMHVEPVDA